jgi:hypothetical protein
MAAERLAAGKRILVAGALAAAAALASIALIGRQIGTGSAAFRPVALLSFPDFRAQCLSACHIDKARDVHGKLAVMAKCEPSELSRFFCVSLFVLRYPALLRMLLSLSACLLSRPLCSLLSSIALMGGGF